MDRGLMFKCYCQHLLCVACILAVVCPSVYAEESHDVLSDAGKVDRKMVADPTRPYKARSASVSSVSGKKRNSYVLSSIVYSDQRAQAVINGKFYVKGDRVDGARIEQIKRDRVLLKDQFGVQTLFWKRAKELRREK